jgi:hypothetical protein
MAGFPPPPFPINSFMIKLQIYINIFTLGNKLIYQNAKLHDLKIIYILEHILLCQLQPPPYQPKTPLNSKTHEHLKCHLLMQVSK